MSDPSPRPPLPTIQNSTITCCMPWLAGRRKDGAYVLETDEYAIIMSGDDLRRWAENVLEQLDADAAREG